MLTTTRVNAITDAEVARADKEVSDLTAKIFSQAAEIDRLKALLAPPPAPPTPSLRTGLYVDGGTLRTKTGAVADIRGIECLWGPTSAGAPALAVAAMKALGANSISPLFQPGQSSNLAVTACINAARIAGMIVGVNADGVDAGRAWVKQQAIVNACNAADNVFLECEVEQGDDSTKAQWQAAAIAFVAELRAAGHTSPIKVGSPLGGRSPRYALDAGAAVLAADPLHNVLFTWQAYWKTGTNGWQFSEDNGFTSKGTAGALQCADALKASGLCFIVGLDGADDIGATPYAELAARLHAHGIGWQWWAMLVGDAYGNGLVSDALSASTLKTPFGPAVKALLQAQATPHLF